ncbi:MAG: hypothetical protein AAF404_13240, partial [Pseudomonadota bacterium]
GLVGSIGDTIGTAGLIGKFDPTSLIAGDTMLAIEASTGDPTIVLRAVGNGYVLFTADEGIFRADTTGSGVIASANDRLIANIIAWAIGQQDPQDLFTTHVNVTPVNDTPVLSGIEPLQLDYTENEGQRIITSTLSLADTDNTQLQAATIAISANFATGEDILDFTNQAGITGNYNGTSGVLTLSVAASVADYTTAIHSVTFENNSDSPSDLSRTVSVTVNDGTADSNTVTRDIAFTSVNDIPVLNALETAPLVYTENDAPIPVTDTLAVTDADNTTIASASVAITGNPATGDVLHFTNQAGITGAYNAATGVLSLNGSASLSDYQSALRSISYENTSDNPSALTRTLSFSISDGSDTGNTITRDINFTAVNDAPVLAGVEASAAAYTENNTPITVTNTLSVSDVDDALITSAEVSISGNFATADQLHFTNQSGITGSFDTGNGRLTLSGTASVADYVTALRSITYDNASDNPSALTRTVSFTINDGEDNSNSLTRDITFTAVNDAPQLSAIETAPLSYSENSPALELSKMLQVNDADDSQLQSATVSIDGNFSTGADALRFNNQAGISGSYNQTTGVLLLTGSASAAQYQTALRTVAFENTSDDPSDLTRTVSINVNDGQSDSNIVSRAITFTAINDVPILSTIEGVPAIFVENDPTLTLTDTLTINDPDNTQLLSATVSVSSNFAGLEDQLVFNNQSGISGSYNSTTGKLQLIGSASISDYENAMRSIAFENTSENPSDLTRTISFQVADGISSSHVVTRQIVFNAVNDVPLLSGIEATAIAYQENDLPVNITDNLLVADPDNLSMVSASVAITGNLDDGHDILSFTGQNGITGSYDTTAGVLQLSGNASLADYQSALRSVTYTNTSDNPLGLTRTIEFTVDDGNTSSNVVSRQIEFSTVNDSPVALSPHTAPAVYTENALPMQFAAALSLVDADNSTLGSATVSISGNLPQRRT